MVALCSLLHHFSPHSLVSELHCAHRLPSSFVMPVSVLQCGCAEYIFKFMLTNSVVVYKNFLIISYIWICILLGQGIVLIVVGLVLRVIVSFLVVLGNGFTIKEMLLVAVAWLPKATVQVWKYFNS